MAVDVTIELNPKIKKDIDNASKQSQDNVINMIFEQDSLIILGYTGSSFCLCKEFLECGIDYNFRIDAGILKSMFNCSKIIFNIEVNKVKIIGMGKNGKVMRRVQANYSSDPTMRYLVDDYKGLISRLRSGSACDNLLSLKHFDKISRVNNKEERGVVISKKQFYTAGEGYKFFARTELDFECFVKGDDLKDLIEFVNSNDVILYNMGGYLVAKNVNNCFLGIRVANPKDEVDDINKILERRPECYFKVDLTELRGSIKPIKVTNVESSKIIFKLENDCMFISTKSYVYEIPFEYKNLNGKPNKTLELDFKLFNKLIQSIEFNNSMFLVYDRFIAILCDEEILLISRG